MGMPYFSEKACCVSLFVRLWVEILTSVKQDFSWIVSLFVRLWVEICHSTHQKQDITCQPLREAVSWNVVLLVVIFFEWSVSLFVRLWVEIHQSNFSSSRLTTSASSWGCELKYFWGISPLTGLSQPLREAVSWNTKYSHAGTLPVVSASSWGCELKFPRSGGCHPESLSASSWGCELKLKLL